MHAVGILCVLRHVEVVEHSRGVNTENTRIGRGRKLFGNIHVDLQRATEEAVCDLQSSVSVSECSAEEVRTIFLSPNTSPRRKSI